MMQCNRTHTQTVRAARVTLCWWWLLSTLDPSCKFWLKRFCGHNINAKRNAHRDKVSLSKEHFKFTREPDAGAIWKSKPKAASSGGTAWESLGTKVSTSLLSDSIPDFPHQTFCQYADFIHYLGLCIANLHFSFTDGRFGLRSGLPFKRISSVCSSKCSYFIN